MTLKIFIFFILLILSLFPLQIFKKWPSFSAFRMNPLHESGKTATPALTKPILNSQREIQQCSNIPPLPSTLSTFTDSLPLPALLIFDLDYTLWPFHVDSHINGALKSASLTPPNTCMLDRSGKSFAFYPDVPVILAAARKKGIMMSLASRTHPPDLADEILRGLYVAQASSSDDNGHYSRRDRKLLRAIDFFIHTQIYPGTKTTHFRRIQDATTRDGETVSFKDMLFFDDDERNHHIGTELGVTFHLVKDGVTTEDIDQGIWKWRDGSGVTHSSR